MRRSMPFPIMLMILTALLIGSSLAQETDLRLIAVREKTIEDPNFAVRIFGADGAVQSNGARSDPRKVVVAAVLDSSEYGTAAIFAGSEKLIVVGNNLQPGGDGVVIQDYQTAPASRIGGPQIVETCHLLEGSTSGDIIPQAEADDAAIGAIALVIMKPDAPQAEIDEATALMRRYFDVPRNPSVTHASQQNTISWVTSKLVKEYNIYWNTSPGVTIETAAKIAGIVSPPFVHSGLTNGTTYFYVVTAIRETEVSGGVFVQVESIIDPSNYPNQEVNGTPSI